MYSNPLAIATRCLMAIDAITVDFCIPQKKGRGVGGLFQDHERMNVRKSYSSFFFSSLFFFFIILPLRLFKLPVEPLDKATLDPGHIQRTLPVEVHKLPSQPLQLGYGDWCHGQVQCWGSCSRRCRRHIADDDLSASFTRMVSLVREHGVDHLLRATVQVVDVVRRWSGLL